jgi:hypothetical protein
MPLERGGTFTPVSTSHNPTVMTFVTPSEPPIWGVEANVQTPNPTNLPTPEPTYHATKEPSNNPTSFPLQTTPTIGVENAAIHTLMPTEASTHEPTLLLVVRGPPEGVEDEDEGEGKGGKKGGDDDDDGTHNIEGKKGIDDDDYEKKNSGKKERNANDDGIKGGYSDDDYHYVNGSASGKGGGYSDEDTYSESTTVSSSGKGGVNSDEDDDDGSGGKKGDVKQDVSLIDEEHHEGKGIGCRKPTDDAERNGEKLFLEYNCWHLSYL